MTHEISELKGPYVVGAFIDEMSKAMCVACYNSSAITVCDPIMYDCSDEVGALPCEKCGSELL